MKSLISRINALRLIVVGIYWRDGHEDGVSAVMRNYKSGETHERLFEVAHMRV